jgi:hypothetical protein
MSRSEQARGETKTRFERVSKAIDQLIEAATYEQESGAVPGTSETFKSAFEKLRELRGDGKSSDPVVQAIRGVIAMVETRGLRRDLPGMLVERKKELQKQFERLTSLIERV